jgi:hypothetical protein
LLRSLLLLLRFCLLRAAAWVWFRCLERPATSGSSFFRAEFYCFPLMT